MRTEPAAPSAREDRLHEAVLVYLAEADAGRPPDPAAFLARYPDLAKDLQEFLATQDRLDPLLAPLRAVSPARSFVEASGPTDDPEATTPHPLQNYAGEPPPVIPGYEILGVLGQGGMGVVYRARQVHMNRVVALKVIRASRLPGAAGRERFRAEAQAVAKVDHPNVVRVYDSGELEGRPYLAMELVQGGTLKEACERQPWLPRAAAELVARLALAMECAHRQGVIHRDLKPANVLLTAGGDAKVADFGLARHLGDEAGQTQPGDRLRTVAYMSPEQADGRTDALGPATDVYGLGGILYALLTGRPPHQGSSVSEVLSQARRGEVAPPRRLNPRVPAALERICLRALAADPAGRQASAAALADELRRYLHRRRLLASVAGAAAALLVVSVAAWLLVAATRGTSPGVAATPTPSTESSTPLPLKGWIDVRVWDGAKARNERTLAAGAATALGMLVEPLGQGPVGGLTPLLAMRSERLNPARRGLYLHQLDALPLRVLDQIQVEVEGLTRPMFLYVVWINSAGKPLPLYPWREFQWDQRPAEEQVVARLKLPEGAVEDGWLMDEGVSGMETLLLLVRDSKLSPEGETALKAALEEVGPQRLQDGKTDAAVWFENGAVVTAEKGRAPKSFDAGRIDDPVLRTQGVLRDKLGPHFDFTRAVSFAFSGN
jgi:tRNA A-37 threonylcarbamoyl transferase component Bud32